MKVKPFRTALWILCIALLGWYLCAYYQLRKERYFVHHRTEPPVRHEIILDGESGPFLFAAAALSGEGNNVDAIAASYHREQVFYYWFFTPCRLAEICYWFIVDH